MGEQDIKYQWDRAKSAMAKLLLKRSRTVDLLVRDGIEVHGWLQRRAAGRIEPSFADAREQAVYELGKRAVRFAEALDTLYAEARALNIAIDSFEIDHGGRANGRK